MLAAILSGVLCGCSDDLQEEIPQGVQIKAFSPTAVMEGCEMIITGANLQQVDAIIFPENIRVDNFEVVTSNMIRVTVPASVSEGTLRLVTGDAVVESAVTMRPAVPMIRSMEPGDEARELEVLTFKGEDLECISKVIFPGEDGDIVVDAMSFMRKSSGHLKLRVPTGVSGGFAPIRLIAIDGSEIMSQEINLLAASKDPAGSVTCNIYHVGSGRYLTRNSAEEYPRVMSATGSRDQEFVFLPVDGEPGAYFLKNKATGEFLIIGDENDWRMIWVFDPTTLAYPEKAMYEIVNLPDGNVQIHNLSSQMLGTDSNDENSEVYGNKSGESEPRFLWRLNIISGTFDVPGSGYSEVLWEGSAELTWDGSTAPAVDGSKCANIIAGDKIILTFSHIGDAGGWPSCYIRSKSDAELAGTGLWDYSGKEMPFDVSIEILYDLSIVDGFKEGFYLVGTGATLSKVSVEHTGDPTIEIPADDNVIYFTPEPFLISWDAAIEISKDKFADVMAGQYISITVTAFEEGQDWPQVRVTSNWNDVAYLTLTDSEYNKGVFPFNASFRIDEDQLALMKDNGLRIDGVGAFISMVTYTDGPQ